MGAVGRRAVQPPVEAHGWICVPFAPAARDFRDQLTSLSGLQNVAVAREVANNCFVVQSEKPHSRVSWQVTGIRKVRQANAQRVRVQIPKTAADRRTTALAPRLLLARR